MIITMFHLQKPMEVDDKCTTRSTDTKAINHKSTAMKEIKCHFVVRIFFQEFLSKILLFFNFTQEFKTFIQEFLKLFARKSGNN